MVENEKYICIEDIYDLPNNPNKISIHKGEIFLFKGVFSFDEYKFLFVNLNKAPFLDWFLNDKELEKMKSIIEYRELQLNKILNG